MILFPFCSNGLQFTPTPAIDKTLDHLVWTELRPSIKIFRTFPFQIFTNFIHFASARSGVFWNVTKLCNNFDSFSDIDYLFHDYNVNRFFNLFWKVINFITYEQNKCSGFTRLSTHFSTSNFVDNVYNSVYNSIFSHFLHFFMWITFGFAHVIHIIFFCFILTFGYFVHPHFFADSFS